MTYVISVGRSIPPYQMEQAEAKMLVKELFRYTSKQVDRLLPVFDNAEVKARQFVVDVPWFKKEHTFEEKNQLYQKYALEHALKASDDCLHNMDFLKKPIPYEAIDMIIFVSSTGLATPTIDAHLLNERPFRENLIRVPLWGLGCAGGAMGLARAFDWTTAYPQAAVLVICCELVSLTFQKGDVKKSNIVGTALFGDGISAALIIGEKSPLLTYRKKSTPKILAASSFTKRNSTGVMGWNITNSGLEVVFSKSIPALIHSFWKDHINEFIREQNLHKDAIHSFIAHPGGKKVLEAMEEVLNCSRDKLYYSYQVLKHHGNMSSATVLHVLGQWMKENIRQGEKSILSALGPGFSSELLALEWE